MPLKKTVAMERRIDLASLFCLIARHGPAVLVTLMVIGCSLAGFIMFRNMREQRRRRAARAERRDSRAGQGDASLGPREGEEPCAEAEVYRRGSTDEDEHTYHTHVRHRRDVPDRDPYKDKRVDGDAVIERAPYSFFWHRYSPKATENNEADETNYSERNYSHPSPEEVTEEVCAVKDPELINDVGYEAQEKVIEPDSSEDITSTAEDVSEEEFAHEDETAQFIFNSQSCSAPAPTFSADDGETRIKQEEHEYESNSSPVLKQDEISSGLYTDEITVEQVQNMPLQSAEPPAMPSSNSEQPADMSCKDATLSTSMTIEVMEEDIIEAINNNACESEPFELVDAKDDSSLVSTAEVKVSVDLSSNSQQIEPPIHVTSQVEVEQNGLDPQELSRFETDSEISSTQKDTELVKLDCTTTMSEDGISNLETVLDYSDVQVVEAKSLETEAALLSEDESAVQDQQVQNVNEACTENVTDQKDDICNNKQTLPIWEENIVTVLEQEEGQSSNVDKHEECLVHLPTSQSQLDEIMKEETGLAGFATDVEENSTVTDTEMVQTTEAKLLEGTPDMDTETILLPSQTSENKSTQTCEKDESIDTTNISASTRDKIESMVEQMVAEVYNDVTQAALEAKPTQLEETKSSELAQEIDSKTEIMVVQTVTEKDNDVTHTALELNPMQKEGKHSECAQDKDGKIESMVAQMVADVYKDVTQMALEVKSVHLEEIKSPDLGQDENSKIECMVEKIVDEVYKDVTQMTLETMPMKQEPSRPSELAQDSDGVAPNNLSINKEEKEVDINSDVAAQSAEEHVNSVSCLSNNAKVEKDGFVARDASESTSSYDSNIPVTDTAPNPEQSNLSAEAKHLEMDKSEMLVTEDTPLVQQMVPEVKSTQMEQHTSIAQLVELVVQPILDFNSGGHNLFTNESTLKVSGEDLHIADASSNMALSCPEVSNNEKVEDEEKIQSGLGVKIVESTEMSQFELGSEETKSIVVSDIGEGFSNKTETEEDHVLLEKECSLQAIPSTFEVTENLVTSNDAQKQSEMLLDTSNNFSNTAVKSGKVVIVCRTMEASISTTEMSEGEDDLYGETSLELTSSKSSSNQDMHINRNSVSEVHAEVSSCGDTLTAQSVIETMSTEEKQFAESGKPFDLTGVALNGLQNGSTSIESTEPIEQRDDAACTPSLESGISSSTVSPEEEESNEVIGQDTLTAHQVCNEEKFSLGGYTSDGLESVAMETGLQTSCSRKISALDEMSNESSLTNEDSFGSEIEDGYHKATEEIMTQVVDSIKDETKDEAKEIVKNVKKEQACAASKENGEKVDSEKTDISIMEATMDHNEWITDGNYQALPWMTAAGFSKDSISSKEAKDVESKPQAQTSSAEESMENAKKVLAVQPMPQNVNVTFRVHYVTLTPHQTVALTGDQPELGSWKSVIPLEKTKDGYWTCVVGLPAESHVEWKFVILEKGEVCRWEECGNRLLYTGFGDDLLVHKWWGFL